MENQCYLIHSASIHLGENDHPPATIFCISFRLIMHAIIAQGQTANEFICIFDRTNAGPICEGRSALALGISFCHVKYTISRLSNHAKLECNEKRSSMKRLQTILMHWKMGSNSIIAHSGCSWITRIVLWKWKQQLPKMAHGRSLLSFEEIYISVRPWNALNMYVHCTLVLLLACLMWMYYTISFHSFL